MRWRSYVLDDRRVDGHRPQPLGNVAEFASRRCRRGRSPAGEPKLRPDEAAPDRVQLMDYLAGARRVHIDGDASQADECAGHIVAVWLESVECHAPATLADLEQVGHLLQCEAEPLGSLMTRRVCTARSS